MSITESKNVKQGLYAKEEDKWSWREKGITGEERRGFETTMGEAVGTNMRGA